MPDGYLLINHHTLGEILKQVPNAAVLSAREIEAKGPNDLDGAGAVGGWARRLIKGNFSSYFERGSRPPLFDVAVLVDATQYDPTVYTGRWVGRSGKANLVFIVDPERLPDYLRTIRFMDFEAYKRIVLESRDDLFKKGTNCLTASPVHLVPADPLTYGRDFNVRLFSAPRLNPAAQAVYDTLKSRYVDDYGGGKVSLPSLDKYRTTDRQVLATLPKQDQAEVAANLLLQLRMKLLPSGGAHADTPPTALVVTFPILARIEYRWDTGTNGADITATLEVSGDLGQFMQTAVFEPSTSTAEYADQRRPKIVAVGLAAKAYRDFANWPKLAAMEQNKK